MEFLFRNRVSDDGKHQGSLSRFALSICCLVLGIVGITSQAYAAVQLSVSPASTSRIATVTTIFTATATNASDTASSWSAVDGTLLASGSYTAPSVLCTSTLIDTITATSIQDNTEGAAVTVSSALDGYPSLDEGSTYKLSQ